MSDPFDIPKLLSEPQAPDRSVLNQHYAKLFPQYDWQLHADCMNLAKEYCWILNDIITSQDPRWLSALGHSGTGKTEWSNRLKAELKRRGYHVQMWNWTHICDEYLNKGDYGILRHLEKIPILIIDEIGQSDWATGTKKLTHLLDRRMRKFTVCISNLSQGDIAENLDVRIASRMNRGNNRIAVMGAECPDYDQHMKTKRKESE